MITESILQVSGGLVSDLTETQREFVLDDKSTPCVFAGGFGAGKTHSLSVKLICYLEKYRVPMLLAAPTLEIITEDGALDHIQKMLVQEGVGSKYNQKRKKLTIDGLPHVLCRSLRDRYSKIGYSVGAAFLDEIDVMPMKQAIRAMKGVIGRVRLPLPDGQRNQVVMASTQDNRFINDYVRDLPCSRVYLGSTEENKGNLQKNYIDDMVDIYGSRSACVDGEPMRTGFAEKVKVRML